MAADDDDRARKLRKAWENRLRAKAKRQHREFSKSRARDPDHDDYGKMTIVDHRERREGIYFELTEVEAVLTGRKPLPDKVRRTRSVDAELEALDELSDDDLDES